MPATAVFDHLVVAAATLELGEAYIEQRLGAHAQRGGRHGRMGTHNSLLKLGGKSYIEVIAIDPAAPAPERPRWFGLDTAELHAALRQGPRLVHWLARTDDIATARRAFREDPGEDCPMTRGSFAWRITVPADGHVPAGGVLPGLIRWLDARHPADALPESRVRLVALAGAHPAPGPIRQTLAALALSDTIKITYGAQPRLVAMLQTARGPVTL